MGTRGGKWEEKVPFFVKSCSSGLERTMVFGLEGWRLEEVGVINKHFRGWGEVSVGFRPWVFPGLAGAPPGQIT